MQKTFKIFRFDPETDEKPRYQTYSVSAEPNERILDCLNRIKWEQDGTLAYRMSCGHGVCGSDAMKINGKCGLACQKLIQDYEDGEIVIEPLPSYDVLKDLIVDLEPFYRRVRQIQPHLISAIRPGETERLQSPEDQKKYDTAIRCILCACCTGACPVFNENDRFLGPAALVWAFRFIFDTRDEKHDDRLNAVDYPDGAWACQNHFECTRACPKDIPVTKYINTIKREIRKVFPDDGRK